MSLQEFNAEQAPSPPTNFANLAEQSAAAEASMLPRAGATVDRANALISLTVLFAVLGCVAIAVYPLFSEWTMPRDMHPLSLMLWLRGENVTAEQWLQREAQAQQREWDRMYRVSPAYLDSHQLPQGLIYQPDWNQFNQFNDWANGWQSNNGANNWQPSPSFP